MLEGREGAARTWASSTSACPGPRKKDEREAMIAGTGQKLYPAIEFEDGTWYREQSKDMAAAIRAGNLGTTAQSSG